LQQVEELLARDKSISIIYKELPILGRPSEVAASAALAANRQGRYAELHKRLLATDNVNRTTIRKHAKELGLNYRALISDMDLPSTKEALQRNSLLASQLNIDGTPAYVIGNRVIRGSTGIEDLEKIVLEERSQRQSAASKPK
jgi:protein-disulfide isomerase